MSDRHSIAEQSVAGTDTSVRRLTRAPFVPETNSRLYLLVEFLALFAGLPLLLFTQRHTLEGLIAPTLLFLAAGCTLLLWYDRGFDRTRLWNRQRFKRRFVRAVGIFIPGAAVVVVALGVLRPDLLLTFPQEYPKVWVAIMVTYPFVSVYPQEVIFRAFLFHRYDALFQQNWSKIVASGAAFGLAHIIFANWVAPLMTAASGVWFARTYSRTGSTLQVSIEHGIWGCFAFTIGLGWYVYSGAIG
ncbi:CPBP family intramembrane metalloprotease [Longibacter salinarum]|uniref:CPBP family intramembrane metalloprotease n=1 Tax=Longibacter salinarum TaxID=1850348 RepID=A0A2A8CYB5_9BACT|nr:CPBP family intramembrane glutamic endopeptidase [Longibacter salinarum]PEN13593.1 CPBP family intramembrane metalloprotease [Longibacter salinarum]